MRSKLILLVNALFILGYWATGQVKTIDITSFGAKPNDNISDQAAFNKAADAINKAKGNIRLVLPAGKYIVGKAVNFKGNREKIPTGKVTDVMQLRNCTNVTIEGKGNVQIKFIDNLPFGTLPKRPAGVDSAVHIGSLFRLIECSGITIRNIKADGNNSKFLLLNKWGAGTNPYEREHEGLFLLNCSDVKVENASFCFFGRDGVIVLEDQGKQPVKNLSFTNCIFNNNGRDGVSWCGGENVRFYKCSFDNNSTGKIVTNPGAGLDIEPERNAVCRNGSFIKCSFKNNGGYNLGSVYKEASDVVFDSCIFVGKTVYSLMCQSPRFTFKNSTIAGTCILTYDADKEADGTKLQNCRFTDSMKNAKIYRDNYIVAIKGRYMRFTGCRFESYIVPAVYTEITKKRQLADNENTLFEGCFFYAGFKKASTWNNLPFLVSNSNFINCEFRSAGYANFNSILNIGEKNIHQQKNKFVKGIYTLKD